MTGIILAGGENKRFDGQPKAFLPINGETIFAHIMQTFSELFADILVVTNNPVPFLEWNVRIVKDIYDKRSSLTGIHAGLFYTRTSHAFITACDTPFLHPRLIEKIIQLAQPRHDVIIPRTQAGFEPLCAAYAKRCLPMIQHQMNQDRIKIQAFFNKARLKEISEKVLREIDPELLSFFNINTREDLERASLLVKTLKGARHAVE